MNIVPSNLLSPLCHVIYLVIVIMIFIFAIAVALTVYFQPDFLMKYLAKKFPHALWFGKTKKQVCALTIDDAPSDSTEAILDVLNKYNVKATFFIISGNVKGREATLKRMVAEGHFLGNHMTRDYPSYKYSKEEFEEKLMECEKEIRKFQPEGNKGKFMRPGSGWFNSSMVQVCEAHSYRICLGNVYPHDAQIKFKWLNAWYLRTRVRSGCLIIVHDRPWTIDVLQNSLDTITSEMSFISLQELNKYSHEQSSKNEKAQ